MSRPLSIADDDDDDFINLKADAEAGKKPGHYCIEICYFICLKN